MINIPTESKAGLTGIRVVVVNSYTDYLYTNRHIHIIILLTEVKTGLNLLGFYNMFASTKSVMNSGS